jgi:copper resistance protein B
MSRLALLLLLPAIIASPAAAQPMDPNMAGMTMSATKPKPAVKHAVLKRAARSSLKAPSAHTGHDMSQMPGMAMPTSPAKPSSHAGHDMSAMPGMIMPASPTAAGPHAEHDMSSMPGMSKPGTPAMPGMDMSGSATGRHDMAAMGPPSVADNPNPAPPEPSDHAAERFYDPAAMAAARQQLRFEHGGATYSMVMANIAEYQARSGGGGYRWEGQAWFGGDINRFVVTTEGEGARRGGVTAGEVQGLYSHAIGPYFDLQAGVRHDFRPGPSRNFATVGVQGLAPYWFDVQGALFLSDHGELLGRAEASYDLRFTQRLILQPRVELNLAAQDTREIQSGSGLSDASLDLRLRYEVTREFAPYVGVSYQRRFGKTADYARLAGERAEATSLVFGIRSFF